MQPFSPRPIFLGETVVSHLGRVPLHIKYSVEANQAYTELRNVSV